MDPKQTPPPTPFNAGQPQPSQDAGFRSTSMQDETQPPAANQPMPGDANEVTVDFSQAPQDAGQNATQPTDAFAPGAMPSLTSEGPQASASATPGAQPSAPGADPYASAGQGASDGSGQPSYGGQPGAEQFGAAAPAPGADPYSTNPAAPASAAPAQPQDTFQNPAQSAPAFGGAPTDPGAQSMPPQQSSQQLFQADTQAPTIPATAPVGGIKADKKTIFILAGVAVVLIVAIAVLIFM